MFDIQQMLTPSFIINFLKNSADLKKIGMNLINSEEAKAFIENDLGFDYNSLKENLTIALASTKKSLAGEKKKQEMEESQKLEAYRNIANSLIKDDGLSVYSAIILAAGFVGIDTKKVVEFLNSKGYSATKERVLHYYNNNEGFLKSLFKKHGKIVPGWNDSIDSSDLELEEIPKTNNKNEKEKLVEVPDEILEEQITVS